jgi:acetolactate synthase-1/2/3 large subunit
VKGIQLFVQELQRRGVPFIATLCGHGLNFLDEACEAAGLPLVDVRNEQAAGYIAEVTGRLTRQVGVCAVSSGVAHINAMTGVVNAYFDGAPMLLITGSASTETAGLGHFQDLDQVALAEPVCKYARTIDRAERIPQILHEAFAAALSGRPGPVHLTLPLNVQNAEVDPDQVLRVVSTPEVKASASAAIPERVTRVADLLSEAERPLLIAGSGVYYAGGEEALASFAKALAIPVVVPIWDRGAVPRPIDEFMGVLGAATGGPRLLPDADLILMVGALCDYRVGYLQPPAIQEGAQVVRIDVDPAQLHQGVGAHTSILGDPRSVLTQLTAVCASRGVKAHRAWLQEARVRHQEFRQRCLDTRQRAPEGLHALDIIQAVQSVLTDDTILLVDGGNIGQWVHQILCDRYPGHWLTCGASGVVGYGLPGAMAACVLYPERPVILISGDGSIGFTIAELEAAARQKLGFVVVLADDQAWGITLTAQRGMFGHGITSELGPTRYDLVAEAFSGRGVRVTKAEEIEPAIREGFASKQPTLIHVPVVTSNPADQ